ncbi:MAG: hypothetical protein CMP22_07560 [Rickettsiales bacterium]|nr:hypothetical protein [Rickettsiales bacterium]
MGEIVDSSDQAVTQKAKGGKVSLTKNKFTYTGTGGEIFKIWIINILLSIVTLGIYSFWGKTKMRRYLASVLSIGGSRLEYTGTGKEIFMGFIKVFPLFAVAIGLVIFLQNPIVTLVVYAGLGFLALAGIYAGLKYKASRTTWRGIRAKVEGSIFKYALFRIKWLFLRAVSFGLLIPRADLRVTEYVYNNAYIGDAKFHFKFSDDSLKTLFRRHMATLLFYVIALIIFVAGFAVAGFSTILSVLLVFVGVIGMVISRVPYKVTLIKEQMKYLYLVDNKKQFLRFKSTISLKEYVKFQLKIACLVIFTFGLGIPFVIHANMKFVVEHLIIGGELDKLELGQASGPREGNEGIEDLFTGDDGLGAFVG